MLNKHLSEIRREEVRPGTTGDGMLSPTVARGLNTPGPSPRWVALPQGSPDRGAVGTGALPYCDMMMSTVSSAAPYHYGLVG